MIKLSDEDIIVNHQKYLEAYVTSSSAPFLEQDFVARAFPKLEAQVNRTYPYQVKIPKSMDRLLQGDFEPAQVIDITEPPEGPWSHVWFGDSGKGVALRSGYINGDSRLICGHVMGDANVHGLLGGSTGQGKSVTLNALIYGMCMEYAPWDLNLTMCDAKVVEFKSYALDTPMPHISAIAATSDTDYLISVLEDKCEEMLKFNSVLTNAKVKDINNFRKNTGLSYPQHVIIIDEFQTMFALAGRKMDTLLKVIANFAKLGRNTGYHLFLASQEIGSEINKNTLANITYRSAVGCLPDVSSKILGNDEARKNMQKYGRLIVNQKPGEEQKSDNIHIRVPFMKDDTRIAAGKHLIELGKRYNFGYHLSFYDEQKVIYESQYLEYLKQFTNTKSNLLLGDPSFVMNDLEQVVKLNLNGKECENICILAGNNANMERHVKMLKYNMELRPEIKHIVISGDAMYSDRCSIESLVDTKTNFTTSKMFPNMTWNVAFFNIYKRKLCLAVEELVFGEGHYDDAFDSDFYNAFSKGSKYDSLINRKRFYSARSVLKTDTLVAEGLGITSTLSKDKQEALELKFAKQNVEMCDIFGCCSKRLSYDTFPMINIWALALHKIRGIGVDSNGRMMTMLKKAMTDCETVNVRFIVSTQNMEEFSPLLSVLRWFIIDEVQPSDLNRAKISDYYPTKVSKILAVLFDKNKNGDKCVKFKKVALEGEILV